MPCYFPLQATFSVRQDGKKSIQFSNANASLFRQGVKPFGENNISIPCGKCMGCRLEKSRQWALRCVHEAKMYEDNCFITLTYRDKYDCSTKQLEKGYHVPDDWSLHKSHFQKFMKRLRNYFPNQEIRYFCAGEYGRNCKHNVNLEVDECGLCHTGRPHYHVCLFNCSFPDLEAYQSDGGVMRYTSPLLEKIWGMARS